MVVYVISVDGRPLMPCSPRKARVLLRDGKAKVLRREPFTIKLLQKSGNAVQEIVGGVDTGSKKIGVAAVGNGKVLYQAEVTPRQNVKCRMAQRLMYRRNRRGRKTRYRPARWQNRASMRAEGRLAPSIRSKVDSHKREMAFVESIVPITRWIVEVADFDIHKIINPEVEGKGYQEGDKKGFYNVKTYVLHRDEYKCQSKRKGPHSEKLHVHHIQFRSLGGTDAPSNLVTLCERCHEELHEGLWEYKPRKKPCTKHATEIGIVKGALQRELKFTATYGYETKFNRESVHGLPKSHMADAVAIASPDRAVVQVCTPYRKVHVAKGDYQLHKGQHSQTRIPRGKLFGIRKYDRVITPKGIGYVYGKRATGFFEVRQLGGNVWPHVNVKKNVVRLSAASTTLIEAFA